MAVSVQKKLDMSENYIVIPRKLIHSGNKRAYPSSFIWDCPLCGHWNIWNTNKPIGKTNVRCMECLKPFVLDKSNAKEEIIRTKKMKSIID